MAWRAPPFPHTLATRSCKQKNRFHLFIFKGKAVPLQAIMRKLLFNPRQVFRFKRFSNKGYALFSCLGKEVIVGVLSVATLTYAKADGISTRTDMADDSLSHKEVKLNEIVVTGSRAPLTALQSAKIVKVITRDDIHRAAATTLNDVLKLTVGVDVRQRGGFGVQTDISINGGTFDQITILLNGVCISNPQTGHNASDFPLSPSDIERIEVLEGAAARVFGTSAFNGAINIVTRQDAQSGVRATVQGGSYGTVMASAGATFVGKKGWRNQLSGGYSQSDGGTLHSDFQKHHGFYDGNWNTSYVDLSWQLGLSTQDYGANTFYSAKYDDQWEKTSHLVASVAARIHNLPQGLEIKPTVYWNRFRDHYQLIRGQQGASAGENYHLTDMYGASVNTHLSWLLGKTAFGADLRRERILSTALGYEMAEKDWESIHGSDRKYSREAKRLNTSFFLEHNIILGGFTLSAGVLANRNDGLDRRYRLYPGVDLSYRPSDAWKFYASWNKALRMPTYTDLFTANAVQQGDPNLLPERNDTYKMGVDWQQGAWQVRWSAFYSHGKDMIDWVYETEESTKYHATNIGRLNNMGSSVEVSLSPTAWMANPWITRINMGYARIHQQHTTEQPIYRSLYALEYLRDKWVTTVDYRIVGPLSGQWSVRWQRRMNGFSPYCKVDGKVQWTATHYRIFVQADNLTAHRYYDLGAIPQPGLWLMAGVAVQW